MARAEHAPFDQPIFHEPTFAEDGTLSDPTGFLTDHPDDNAVFARIRDLLRTDVVAIPPSRSGPDEIYGLAEAYGNHGPQVVETILRSGAINFHMFGDSGAADAGKYANELSVADQVTLDANSSELRDRPAFLFHLGDLVYNFGEARYYYDQFYEPYRNYPAPIFAIPGNHDSFVVPGTQLPPLETFQRNFCSPQRVITPEAGSLHRTAMTQPGVYFTLDAPFVRIIGLFSNTLGDPGVISNQDGKWPAVSNLQIDFLRAQLERIKRDNFPGAVLIATHHPPFSYAPPDGSAGAGGNHAGSSEMLRQIDVVCQETGVYPHAFFSGHSHNYQRYTRIIEFGGGEIDVPFIVCGVGGHALDPLIRPKAGEKPREPRNGEDVRYLEKTPIPKVNHLILAKYDYSSYGYLRVQVDKDYLKIGFHQVNSNRPLAQSRYDMVTVKLAERRLVAN